MELFSSRVSISSLDIYWIYLSNMENSLGSADLDTPMQRSFGYWVSVVT